jgi:hypothetical protein
MCGLFHGRRGGYSGDRGGAKFPLTGFETKSVFCFTGFELGVNFEFFDYLFDLVIVVGHSWVFWGVGSSTVIGRGGGRRAYARRQVFLMICFGVLDVAGGCGVLLEAGK